MVHMISLHEQEKPKILICDDEHLECEALERIFSQSPHAVEVVGTAHNGVDAVRQVACLSPQIVFLDIRMPGLSGLEAARQILAHDSEIQIVILSAYSDFSYAQEALRLGVMDYVLKPAEPALLYEALEKALKRLRSLNMQHEQQSALENKLAEILPALTVAEGSPDDPIQLAIQYIRAHYQEEISLERVARAVALSPAYFSRLFQKRTGSGVREYIIWLRIEAAKFLLKETLLPVGEIAEAVGYQDANHFSVVFKRKVGVPPNHFRKEKGGDT